MTTNASDVWELLDAPPDYASDVADLYHWSANYDAGKGPFTLFLDLIGWSADELGEPIYDMASASLGYVELGKLADALNEYANRPSDVREYVDALLEAEAR